MLTKKQRCFLVRNVREDANYEIGILITFDLHITHFVRFLFQFHWRKFVQSLVETVADRKKRGKKPEKIRFDSYRQWAVVLMVNYISYKT